MDKIDELIKEVRELKAEMKELNKREHESDKLFLYLWEQLKGSPKSDWIKIRYFREDARIEVGSIEVPFTINTTESYLLDEIFLKNGRGKKTKTKFVDLVPNLENEQEEVKKLHTAAKNIQNKISKTCKRSDIIQVTQSSIFVKNKLTYQ